MKRKKYHKNKITKKDYNPFNQMWFWLHLASIPMDYSVCDQDKNNPKKNHCVDIQNSR